MPSLLVTGASRGLGLELCRQYADAGWRVFACCRRPGHATGLTPVVDKAQGRVTLHRMNVDDAGEVQAVANELEGTPIDILINNAGLADSYGTGVLEGNDDPDLRNYDMAEWLRILNTNVVSVGRVTGAFADNVAASDRKIIAMMASSLSSVGNTWQAGRYAYRTSKAGLNMLMRGVGAWLEPRHVTVVSVAPGWTRTELGGPRAHHGVEEAVERVRALLERLTLNDTGSCWNYDGERIPW